MSEEEEQIDTDPPKGWTDITGIYYGFNDHCETKSYPGIHKTLRVGLAETTRNVEEYFTDPERTTFKGSTDVIKILRKTIVQSITEEATQTTKTERIEPIVNSLPILFRYMDNSNGIHQAKEIKIKNSKNLEEAFEVTRKNKGNTVSLVLDINGLHFKTGREFRAKNFDHIGNDANPVEEDGGIDIEVEDNTGKEDPTTTSAMIDMMKKLVDTIASKEAAAEAREFGPSNPSHTPISLKNFNIDSLQEDVKQRVINHGKEGYYMPHTEMKPYLTDIPDMWRDPSGETMRTSISHFIVPNILATKDGHLFRAFTEKSIEKRFTHDVPEFDSSQDVNPTTVRMWYHEFVKHGMGSGVYIHPYYCFRPGANSVHGFTCGTDTDNEQFDLPSAFAPALDRWTLLVATALQGVFPKGSHERSICNHNVTNGYAALRNIIIPNHPSFHEHGPSMAIHPPLQTRRHDIFQHFDLYQDHLEMKAFTQNVSTDLESPDQIVNFILSCRYGNQILIKSRDERRSKDSMMRFKWGYGQITSTLSSYLETVVDKAKPPFTNSIRTARIPDPSPVKGSYGKGRRSPQRNRDDRKGRKEYKDRSKSPSTKKPQPIKKIKIDRDAIRQVEDMIPDVETPEDQYRVAIYKLGIHSIKKTGEFDVSQRCLVCKKAGHTFDDCPILNDHDLLKKVHISFCSLCRRIQKQTEDATPQTIHGQKKKTISWSRPIATKTHCLPDKRKAGGGHKEEKKTETETEAFGDDEHESHEEERDENITMNINAVNTETIDNQVKVRNEDVTLLRMDMYDLDEQDSEQDSGKEKNVPVTREEILLCNSSFEDEYVDPNAIRAQIDTGAKVSVTNLKHALHKYRKYGKKYRSPITLSGAIDENTVVKPEGCGYIRIPSENMKGYIDVKTYYSPRLTSTLMSENCILRSSVPKKEYEKYNTQTITKDFGRDKDKMTGSLLITNYHENNSRKDINITGVILGGQCFTHPILFPNLDGDDPEANEYNSSEYAMRMDGEFRQAVKDATESEIQIYKIERYIQLAEEMSALPRCWSKHTDDIMTLINHSVPIHAIRTRTEKMLWHQRLGHPCDEYLYQAHKYIKGVPKFDRETPVLDQCPTCIQAKQSKEPKGAKSTRKATVPYQGLSIDFSFSGTKSKDEGRRKDFEGLNGETCYILVTDHYTGMKHGDTRLSKAPPVTWLRRFLSVYSPNCKDKYVHMDQGGELFNSPDIKNLFAEYDYHILPTGADNSRQNGPVERAHRTIGNGIRSLLYGAGIDIRFWPYAFYHMLRLSNALPERNRYKSPLEMSTGNKEDFSHLRTFGCRVWVRPVGGRTSKYKTNSRKGTFLGYTPHTTRNIIWYDSETDRIKIASHARFDEGMNDLPLAEIPPNVQQLQRSNDGGTIPQDPHDIDEDMLQFHAQRFPDVITKVIKTNQQLDKQLHISEDSLSKRAYISSIPPKSNLSNLFSSPKAARNKLQGAYLLTINGEPVFSAADVHSRLQDLQAQGVTELVIQFAPTPKLDSKRRTKETNEFGLLHPNTNPQSPDIRSYKESEEKDIIEREPIARKTKSRNRNHIGNRVAKQFDTGIFFGTVSELWKEKGKERWQVKYDDDDVEDMNEKELEKAMRLYKTRKHEDPKWRNRQRNITIKRIMAKVNKNELPGLSNEEMDDMFGHVPSIDMNSIRAISRIRASAQKRNQNKWLNEGNRYSEENLPIEFIETVINAIQSQATTPEEQALGYFTRKKLKRLNTWHLWREGEKKQLNQFEALGMYGEPTLIQDREKSIVLRPHWQYNIKRDGTRRSRLCCNGSKKAAPLLHSIASTYSSCVEHPIQRLFLGIAASLNLKIYGGDAKDAYGHSPGPEIPTFMSIDDAYSEWYEEKYGKKLDKRMVLPVRKALQGHPESGRLWEAHITGILKNIGFTSTTHDKTIYKMDYSHEDERGKETIYMLRQVDDFALACKDEDTATKIYDRIGEALQTEKETAPPFAYLGLINDFNGVDISQTNEYVEISCKNYIDRVMRSHGWEAESNATTNTASPMSKDALDQIFSHEGYKEGTREHKELEEKFGFSYRTLLGELMFCYVSCRCDIGYAITLLSKFSSSPSEYHYNCLKNVARYLRTTKAWGIRYKRNEKRTDLPKGDFSDLPKTSVESLPEFPIDTATDKLVCFVDAAYANDKHKRRSTTGFVFTYSGGAIVYRSKAQSITALSSTEAELVAAVTAAKTARFIRAVLSELGFPQNGPTPIYEDNKPTIDIVNSKKPTQRSRHIDIRFFAIQDWLDNKDISMHHISGVINPADDLTKPLGWVLHSRHARYMMGHGHYQDNRDDTSNDRTPTSDTRE